MIDATFDVTPFGIVGMNKLATFPNTLKKSSAIKDWHPMRAVSGTQGARYIVQFADDRDADSAVAQWTSLPKA